ncbi:aminotransferase class I/II-fold pyridoxal phosphate-dependent enzyme [Candidatus Dojkabacteria bacterium]|nr:aminotransferase class I/II-fold pyridoxal phosphate-dependent enzyme [Candidatus Dojkabacteria bacterium]
MNYEKLFADRAEIMSVSAIREILKVVNQPGMISLAGGIPAPESFPMDILEQLCSDVIKKYGDKAFQYDLTEGFIPLREALVGFVGRKGIETKVDNIMITTGSQGVLDSIGKILLNKGDKVAVEAPTYLGAIQAFNPYLPEYISMETDEDGLIPESLEGTLKNHNIKMVYLVPTFQNPTGRTIPIDRRKRIAEIIKKNDAFLVEDDPYGELRYRGDKVAPIQTLAPDNVLYTSTLSKLFAPGLRIGYFIAPPKISYMMVMAKQGVDLHTSTFSQALAAEYISAGHMDKQIPKIISVYKPRQEAMLEAISENFPKGFNWSKPEGGMFIWAEGPQGANMEDIYYKAIKEKVAFVPGKFFYTKKGQGLETMRLNYSKADEKTIKDAIKRLSEVLKSEINN